MKPFSFFCSLLFLLFSVSTHAHAYVVVRSVSVNVGTASPAAEVVNVSVAVPAGLQLFALPGEPSATTTISALQFRDAISRAGGSLTLLVRLNDQGALEPYLQGFTPDFNLVPGHGYIINNARPCTITLRMKNTVTPPAVPVRQGLNILSVPLGGPYTANSLLQDLAAAGGGSNYIVRVKNGQFQIHAPGLAALGTQDFDIEKGQGYIVGSPRAFSWKPKILAAKKTGTSTSKTGGVGTASKTSPAMLLEQAIAAKIMTFDKSNNRPPIMAPFTPISVQQSMTNKILCVDLDGDPLTYGATPRPNGFFLQPYAGTYSWNVIIAKPGTYRINFTASDGKSTTQQTATFIVGKTPPRK